MKVSILNSCSLRGFKRPRVSSEEIEEEFGGNFKNQELYVGNDKDTTGRTVEKELKKMRIDLEHDTSREFTYQNSSSESSSPKTPPFNATESSTQNPYYDHLQFNQEQKHQSSRQQQNNSHKSHHYPLRISTRSDAYSSSSEILNPYVNINSVLYLANLTRNSHIINELQGELGNMDIDERGLVGISESSAIHNSRQSYSHDGISNNCDSLSIHLPSISEYESINMVLKDAFLRRHGSGLEN